MNILTSPKEGRFCINFVDNDVYLSARYIEKVVKVKLEVINEEIDKLKIQYPKAYDFSSYSVRDIQAEYDYEDQYNKSCPPIYQGYVKFKLPV